MARFLFTVWPFAGHVYPNIAVAHALQEKGHEVAFYTGANISSLLEQEGFRRFPFIRVDEDTVSDVVLSQRTVPSLIKNPFPMITIYRRWLLDTVCDQVDDLREIMKIWEPDCFVCDPTFWGPILVLHEQSTIPVAVSSFMVGCMIPGPGAPPWGLGLPLPKTPGTRLLVQTVRSITELLGGSFRRQVNMLRGKYALPPLSGSVNTYTARLPLYLIPSIPELDYNRMDLPTSVHYTGACVWNKKSDNPPPRWLSLLPRNRPWIHVTEGTMHSQKPFVLNAAAAAFAEMDVQVIMTTGGERDPDLLQSDTISSNIRIEQWVPHADLLPLTDIMITTGGAGSILAALTAGVPLIIIPTQWDKPDNAQRVVASGAGIRLSPYRCTPQRLRAAAEKMLATASYRDNAQRLAGIFKQYRGSVRAAELLTDLCRESDCTAAQTGKIS